jgi:monoamine oxidase
MSRLLLILNRKYGPLSRLSQQEMFESRRLALKATLAASAGLLLSGTDAMALPARRAGRRVVVVGAGFAGLACAHELSALGYDVTVVEARGRLGGRVLSFSDFVAGKNIEGGAELIGSNHPAWVNYAKKFNLDFLDVSEEEELFSPIKVGGKLLDEETANAVWEEASEAMNSLNELAANIDSDTPWTAKDARALDSKSIAEFFKGVPAKDVTKLAISAQIAGDNGVADEKASLLGMLAAIKGGGLEKYWTDTEVYRCKGGNQQLAARLADAIGNDRIVLKLPVTRIDTSKSVAVVTCADGRTIECDDVVLAVPPTVWNKIEFRPGLPAIAPQMGVNVKYLTSVKGRFWHEKKQSQWALSDDELSWVWESTDAQGEDGGVGLTAFAGGPAAEKARAYDAGTRDKALGEKVEELKPGFKANFIASRFMDWPADPWAMCGYSFPAPGQVTTVGPILRKGAGNLHFAGEHTCYAFVGYMEGGLSSGIGVAGRIATRDGTRK